MSDQGFTQPLSGPQGLGGIDLPSCFRRINVKNNPGIHFYIDMDFLRDFSSNSEVLSTEFMTDDSFAVVYSHQRNRDIPSSQSCSQTCLAGVPRLRDMAEGLDVYIYFQGFARALIPKGFPGPEKSADEGKFWRLVVVVQR